MPYPRLQTYDVCRRFYYPDDFIDVPVASSQRRAQLVADELVVQVVPPAVVDAGPLEDHLDAAVVNGKQVRALACQELVGRDGRRSP